MLKPDRQSSAPQTGFTIASRQRFLIIEVIDPVISGTHVQVWQTLIDRRSNERAFG